jgi:segregation and condensation protein A
MRYRVKLDIFEGPFDLLLFLIRKNEVDIYDIPIAIITRQFLDYIEVMKILDLNIAGDFIEMVAILMNIKARMLLPSPVTAEGEEAEDPRAELVERLIEYKRFKEVSYELNTLEEERRKLHPRRYFDYVDKTEKISDEAYLEKVTLFDLIVAFRKALDNMPKITYHEVTKIDVTVEQQSAFILEKLHNKKMILFQDLIKEIKERIVLIVTFIALLDLIKDGKIIARQSKVFDDIRIQERKDQNDTSGGSESLNESI